MLDWLARNTDLVALFLAVVGLGVSLFTVWLSVRQARLDAYTRMHEMLVSSEIARGRRILFLAHDQGKLPEPGDADWDAINQSLAVYDTLAVYMQPKDRQRAARPERLVPSSDRHPRTGGRLGEAPRAATVCGTRGPTSTGCSTAPSSTTSSKGAAPINARVSPREPRRHGQRGARRSCASRCH